MPAITPLETLVKEAELPAYIELFEIELSLIGLVNLYLTNSTRSPEGLTLGVSTKKINGINRDIPERVFVPYPIAISGLEENSDGSFSRPQLAVANVDKFFGKLSFTYGDLVGCKVKYIRTFDDMSYLAAGVTAPELTFTIGKKLSHNVKGIAYELRYPMDSERGSMPKNQILCDPHINRTGEWEEYPGVGKNKYIG
jgi:lambda family phage minor tail protein L